MLVIPKKIIGSKGGKANSKQTSGRGVLTARQEAFARCLVINGMSGLQAYRSAYPAAKMSTKQATNEASRLKQHKHVQARMRELNVALMEVDLHDRVETNEFVLAGLKRLALNGDNSAAQLGAYRMIGSLSHARLFDAPVAGVAPDSRTADSIRKALKGRMERLLPPPADEGDQDGGA